MFSGLFGKRATTRSDVMLAVVGALMGLWKALDTIKSYKEEKKEIQ